MLVRNSILMIIFMPVSVLWSMFEPEEVIEFYEDIDAFVSDAEVFASMMFCGLIAWVSIILTISLLVR